MIKENIRTGQRVLSFGLFGEVGTGYAEIR
jgi:hypothetical protein